MLGSLGIITALLHFFCRRESNVAVKKNKGILDMVLGVNRWLISRSCENSCHSFFDPDDFPWVAEVEAATPLIISELDALLGQREHVPAFHEVSRRQLPISDSRWKTFFFFVYGHEIKAATDRCPETTRALRLIPGMSTAMFSILEPGKHIPPHHGPHKGVLRYHLGLRVPSARPEECGIRVGNNIRNWADGKSLIFDDTFEHEAWNRTAQDRAVLFVDFPRPLPLPLAQINRSLSAVAKWLSPDVHEARKNAETFARKLS